MLYRFLKLVVTVGIRLYYKEIRIINRKNFPDSGPCIYIANHPNTLMDAWMIGYASKLPVHFMAKGTLFSSPLKNKILRSLNMIPVNRRGEHTTNGVSNKDSFEACYSMLENKKCLLIFPEGTSFLERHLRELKSGAARIALEAERRNGGRLGIKIVPLGLNYLDADRFRSRVMIHVGQPVSLEKYVQDFEENPGPTAKKLTEVFRIRLEQVLVNSSEKEEELMTEELHEIFSSKYIRQSRKGVAGEFELLKKIRDRMEEIKLTRPWKIEEIRAILKSLSSKLSYYEIRADFLDRRFRTKMFFRQLLVSILLVLIAFPIYAFGLLHNFLQYKITDLLVPKLTRDIEYYAPLSVLLGLIFYPLVYLAFMFGMKYAFELSFRNQLAYFLFMPVSGLLAFSLHTYFRHISVKWRFIYFLLKDKQKMQDLKQEKEKLRALVFGE
ncbi:MAG: lysophospholipid acyltransferase family protein [Bacteroidota bacterium]